jgi:hypothetical protein
MAVDDGFHLQLPELLGVVEIAFLAEEVRDDVAGVAFGREYRGRYRDFSAEQPDLQSASGRSKLLGFLNSLNHPFCCFAVASVSCCIVSGSISPSR